MLRRLGGEPSGVCKGNSYMSYILPEGQAFIHSPKHAQRKYSRIQRVYLPLVLSRVRYLASPCGISQADSSCLSC